MLLLLLLIALTAHEAPVRPALTRPTAAERRRTIRTAAATLRTDRTRTRVVRVRRRSSTAVTPPAAAAEALLDLLRNARLPQLVPRPSSTAVGRRQPVLPRIRTAARRRVVLDRSLSRRAVRRSAAGKSRPRGGRISTGPVPAPAHPASVLLLPRDRAEWPVVYAATRTWSAASVQTAEESLLKGRRAWTSVAAAADRTSVTESALVCPVKECTLLCFVVLELWTTSGAVPACGTHFGRRNSSSP